MSLSCRIPFVALIALSAALFAGDAEDIAGLLNKGRADDALQAADKALSHAPKDARLRLLRGNALVALGRSTEAIQTYASLTADYPTLPEPYNNLAAVYAQQGDLDKARAALQHALQTNPAYATAHANLTDIYGKLAAQAYEKALERDVVERHQNNGQSPTPVVSAAPARLALLQDLVSRGGTASTVAVAAPVRTPTPTPTQVAVVKPVEVRPTPVAITPTPKPTPTVVAVVKPTPAPTPVKPVEAKPTPTPTPTPVPVAKPADNGKETTEQIDKTLQGWAEAWSEKRVSVYLSYYGHSFKAPGKSRSAWETERRERIEGARKIEVKLSSIKIKLDGDHATAHFVQRYRSDRLDTSTGKTLMLEKSGGRWLITEERVG